MRLMELLPVIVGVVIELIANLAAQQRNFAVPAPEFLLNFLKPTSILLAEVSGEGIILFERPVAPLSFGILFHADVLSLQQWLNHSTSHLPAVGNFELRSQPRIQLAAVIT